MVYHRLNGSSSPVLTATSLSYGKAKNSTPHRIKTPNPIEIKFGRVDYVREGTRHAKFYANMLCNATKCLAVMHSCRSVVYLSTLTSLYGGISICYPLHKISQKLWLLVEGACPAYNFVFAHLAKKSELNTLSRVKKLKIIPPITRQNATFYSPGDGTNCIARLYTVRH